MDVLFKNTSWYCRFAKTPTLRTRHLWCSDSSPFEASGHRNRAWPPRTACAHGWPGPSKSRQPVPTGIWGVHQSNRPLVRQIAKQAVEPPNDEDVAGAQRCARQEKANSARRDLEFVTRSLPLKTQRAVEFIKKKGASSWLSVIPLKEMNFALNKRV